MKKMSKLYHLFIEESLILIENDFSWTVNQYIHIKHEIFDSKKEIELFLKKTFDEIELEYSVYKLHECIEDDIDSIDLIYQCEICNEIFESMNDQAEYICQNCLKKSN
jgi:hypothetical protein